MNPNLSKKISSLRHFAALPLIFLVIAALWLNLPEEQYSSVYSTSGSWDLQKFNFDYATASIHGRVEYISAPFLTPDQFAARENEVLRRYPSIGNAPATVRIRLLLPDDVCYVITRISTGGADRIYVNGGLLRDVGSGLEAGNVNLYSPRVTFTARPVNGVIEIIHQESNFIYHVHGAYESGMLDEYTIGNDIQKVAYTTNTILGILLALAVISLLLFLLLYNYRPALLFSLLCLAWFLYTGAMGAKVFVTVAPWFTDPLRLRLMLNITPITAVLMAAIIGDMFPGILHRFFIRGAVLIFSAWAVCFMFVDIGFILSYGLWVCMGMAAIGVTYGIIVMIKKMRQPSVLQFVFVAGVFIIGYASLRDIFTYLNLNIPDFNLLLPPFEGTNFARVGVIAFLLCQSAAIFIATMTEMEKSKKAGEEAETAKQRLAAENAALAGLSRMKTEYLANMSHEIKTPLTVISGNIQQAAEIFGTLGVENEIISRSLNKADDEIMRLARLTKNAVRMAAMQESREKRKPLDLGGLYTVSAEAYRGMIEKQGNTLTIKAGKNLPPVSGNADQLIQVLTNLLSNANTHTKYGVISVTADSKANAGFVTVTVADTGTGISPEFLPYIFERGITGSDGTGIGLAICKNIIETHEGTIEISSIQGKGTAVTFSLPVFSEGEEGSDDV
jgi:signal transduction histidine kinase